MIVGKISVEDFIQAQRLHRKKVAFWSNLLSGIALAVGLVIYLLMGKGILSFGIIGAGIGGLAGEWVTAYLLLPRKAARLHGQQAALRLPITYAWDASGLGVQHEEGQAKTPWKSFVKYRESKEIFLLYFNDDFFQMVPKSWFRDQAQVDGFRELASQAGSA